MFQNDAAAGEAGILPRGAQEEQASSPPEAARNVIQLGTDVSEVDASLRCGAGEGRIFTPSTGQEGRAVRLGGCWSLSSARGRASILPFPD